MLQNSKYTTSKESPIVVVVMLLLNSSLQKKSDIRFPLIFLLNKKNQHTQPFRSLSFIFFQIRLTSVLILLFWWHFSSVDIKHFSHFFFYSGRKRRGSETLSDSSDEGELDYSPWSSSSERAATPVMSECTAAMVLMNLSHAQLAAASAAAAASASSSSSTTSKEQHQQRMMQFLQHDTQNCPQGMSTILSIYL